LLRSGLPLAGGWRYTSQRPFDAVE